MDDQDLLGQTERETIAAATRGYSVRRVPVEAMCCLRRDLRPAAGDLVLARVESVGHHKRLHRTDGSRRTLFVGDLVVLAYADRYAPNQFEAHVPEDLRPCDLIAAGGLAGEVITQHDRIRGGATRLRPLGLIASDPEAPPLNLAGAALEPPPRAEVSVPVLAVVGTAMDAGKTTTAAYLVRGLRNHGDRVGYAKVTGTAAAGDPDLLRDAGAAVVLDFTDAGFASTYRLDPATVEDVFNELVGHLALAGVDAIVVEVADGLLQAETASLVASRSFRARVGSVIFTAGDALGAVGGVHWLAQRKIPTRALSGRLTLAPLQKREAAEATDLPVYDREELLDPATASKLMQPISPPRS